MGRYPGTTLCADPLGGRALRLYCKLRCLIAVLRNVPHMAKTPRPLDLHSWLMPSSLQLPRLARRTAAKNLRLKLGSSGCSSALFCWDNSVPQMCPRAVRFYSSSNKETVRVDAPIGVLQRTQNALHLNSLGARLGESFHRLSKHINVYFKRKDILVEPGAGNASLIVATPQYLGRLQRRGQRAPRQRKEPTQALECDEREDISMSQTSTSTSFQRITGLQLFHISSLATKFGESYNYVANHINTTFSRRPAQEINFSQMQDTLEEPSANRTSHSSRLRRKIQRSYIQTSLDTGKTQVKMSSNPAESPVVENNNVTSKQDEGYLYFARHINCYFGAKVTDEVNEQLKQREQHTVEMMAGNNAASKQFTTQTSAKSHGVLSQLRQEERPSPKPPGLFHISSLTTSFGESYFQMANHINLYFKGQDAVVEEEEEVDKNELREIYPECAATQRLKPVSLMDCLRHPTAAIPNFLGSLLKVSPWAQNNEARPSTTPLEATYNRRMIMSRRQAEEITRGLIRSLESAVSPDVLTASLEALNEHLIRYPSCKAVMWQEKTAVKLLKHRRSSRHNQELQDVIRESLALIGYVDPVKGRGIRVLSIDGGGTRGVVPLQVLKVLRAETGKEIHQLFDYICGVSTGAVLAFMLGLARFSLEECGDMYRRFGSDVFRQNPLVGTVKMGWSHSYYCTATWEAILREKMGETLLIKTARDELSPKVSAVSAVVNWGTSPKAFVFRNYNHTPGCLSRYAGSSACMMWEAVRASSAAPGYFQEFPLQSDIHQDGGLILNNPCSLAVHESRLLWPNQPFQCVLSLGTGRYDNAKRTPATSTSLRAKISNLICSATDTEGVHTLLDDLLAPDVYFRFNPMLSAGVSLDESRPGILDQLEIDTQRYLDRNRPKIARLCLVLGAERLAVTRTKDWVSERAWEMKQRWV